MLNVQFIRTLISLSIICSVLSIGLSYSDGRSFLFPLVLLLTAIIALCLSEARQKRKIKGEQK